MLLELAIHFRFLQLYAHNAHNLIQGESFFADHKFLGGLYSEYEEAYDGTVERMIGLGEDPDLMTLQKSAADMLSDEKEPADCEGWFSRILSGERTTVQLVQKCFDEGEYTQGTLNLLAGMADAAETRIYKITQRLA